MDEATLLRAGGAVGIVVGEEVLLRAEGAVAVVVGEEVLLEAGADFFVVTPPNPSVSGACAVDLDASCFIMFFACFPVMKGLSTDEKEIVRKDANSDVKLFRSICFRLDR